MKTIFISMALLLSSFSATAGCWLDGKEYPVGIVVNGYECGADGYWVKK